MNEQTIDKQKETIAGLTAELEQSRERERLLIFQRDELTAASSTSSRAMQPPRPAAEVIEAEAEILPPEHPHHQGGDDDIDRLYGEE